MNKTLINEIGNKYGSLTVICFARNQEGRAAWLCQCDCGWLKVVRGSDLRKNKITSCGCRRKSREKRIENLIGKKYGFLTVIERADEYYDFKNKKNVWKCQCECGNTCYKKGAELKSGRISSCGCKTGQLIAKSKIENLNLKGKVFGELTVIELVEINDKFFHKCQCQCGNIIYTNTNALTSGKRLSCGCQNNNHSNGERYIANFLKNKSICFQQEFIFKDLLSDSRRYLRFDFALFDKNNKILGLIEYNGQQHYESREIFGGEEGLKRLQLHDNMKKEYCLKHNIPLLTIKYQYNLTKIDPYLEEFISSIGMTEEVNCNGSQN